MVCIVCTGFNRRTEKVEFILCCSFPRRAARQVTTSQWSCDPCEYIFRENTVSMQVFFHLIFKARSFWKTTCYYILLTCHTCHKEYSKCIHRQSWDLIYQRLNTCLDKHFTKECLCSFMCNSSVILGSHCECLVTSYPLCMI